MTAPNTEAIRKLNDAFRSTFTGGTVLMTAEVSELPNVTKLLEEVRQYTAFTDDNDPYGEHDFGSVLFEGQTVFWKLDYYSKDMQSGSSDPADPAQTSRVITLMLASQY